MSTYTTSKCNRAKMSAPGFEPGSLSVKLSNHRPLDHTDSDTSSNITKTSRQYLSLALMEAAAISTKKPRTERQLSDRQQTNDVETS